MKSILEKRVINQILLIVNMMNTMIYLNESAVTKLTNKVLQGDRKNKLITCA